MARKLSSDGFIAALPALDERLELLVATGGFGVTDHQRIGLITVEDPPRVLEDAYLPTRDLDELLRRLRHARPKARARKGGWNTMHATGWGFAWSDDRAPFVLLDSRGQLAWVEDDRLHARDAAPLERLAIVAVEPFVDSGWVTRGVRVRLGDGAVRVIASE